MHLAWQEQQAQLGASVPLGGSAHSKPPVRVSPTELHDEEPKATKSASGRRPFGLSGIKRSSIKPRASLPTKLLPSALRGHRNSNSSATESPQNDSTFDVMAKYQNLSNKKNEDAAIGQLISLDSPSSSVIGKNFMQA